MTDNTKVERIPIHSISENQSFSGDLYVGEYLVHPAEVPVDQHELSGWKFWGIASFELRQKQRSLVSNSKTNIDRYILGNSHSILQNDVKGMRKAKLLYQEIVGFAEKCLITVQGQASFPPDEPQNTVRHFVEKVRHMGSFMLRFEELSPPHGANYIELHAANSFILAIALGLTARLPSHRLLNLGIAALLHEVGQVQFSKLLNSKEQLSSESLERFKAHVSDGVNMLRAYDFATEISDGVLQHHERLDGSGYPYGVAGQGVFDFGRFLGLACSYVAMTTDHKFYETQLGHSALLNLLRQAKTAYDPELVKLLVKLLSLYPVGSFVKLSNGYIGRVLSSNEKNPRLPVVALLLDDKKRPLQREVVVETSPELTVSSPLSSEELKPFLKA